MSKPHSEFVIQSNAAHHRRSWIGPFALLAFICLGVAFRFAWLGYWMILPFAVLDIVVVGLVFTMVLKQGSYTEKILINRDNLRIEHIQDNKDRSWCFPLHWTQLKLRSPDHSWYPHKLVLGWKGQWVEVGRCLTNDERKALATEILNEMNRLQQPEFINHA